MLLKINPTTNRWIAIAAIFQIPLFIFALIMSIDNVTAPKLYSNITFTVLELLFLVSNYYMICVLIFFKEEAFVIAAFVIYTLLDIIRNAPALHIGISEFNNNINGILYLLSFLVKIYLLIAILNLKSIYLKFPFNLFGWSLFVVGFANFAVTLFYAFNSREYENNHVNIARTIINCVDILLILTTVSIFVLTKSVNKFIAQQKV